MVNAEKCTCFSGVQGKCVLSLSLSLSLSHSLTFSLPLSAISSCMDVCLLVCWCRSTRMLRMLYLSWSYVESKCFAPDKWPRNWIRNQTGNMRRKQAIRSLFSLSSLSFSSFLRFAPALRSPLPLSNLRAEVSGEIEREREREKPLLLCPSSGWRMHRPCFLCVLFYMFHVLRCMLLGDRAGGFLFIVLAVLSFVKPIERSELEFECVSCL